MTEWGIRPAAEADAPALAALLNPIIAAGRLARRLPTSADEQRDYLRNFPAAGVLLLACAGNEVVGLQSVAAPERGTANILTFVAMHHHRRGVGRALTDAMFGAAKGKGVKRLRASVPNGNPWALAFYYAMDFRRISGDWPTDIIAERTTEMIALEPSQKAICCILEEMRLSGIDEAAVLAFHGPAALAAAKAIFADAIDAPVDWRHASMEDALDVLSNLLGRRYPWLSFKARASISSAYIYTYK